MAEYDERYKIKNETPTKAIRNAGKMLILKFLALINISSKMKVKYFGNPHYA